VSARDKCSRFGAPPSPNHFSSGRGRRTLISSDFKLEDTPDQCDLPSREDRGRDSVTPRLSLHVKVCSFVDWSKKRLNSSAPGALRMLTSSNVRQGHFDKEANSTGTSDIKL